MENSIQSQMKDNFNQEVFKAIDNIRNKHKQQANIASNFDHITQTTGNQSISKAFLKIE